MITSQQREIIINKLSKYQPQRLGIFGSYARDENREGSDLDVLVKFGSRISLLDLVGLEQELSEMLGIKVDLVTEGALSPYMKPYVEKDYLSILNEGQ